MTPTMPLSHQIDSHCPDYGNMLTRWQLITDLLGGTLAMRAASTRWLPKEPGETDEKYAIRLNRSILFNGFKNAVKGLSSRPFGKPIDLSEGLSARLAAIEMNANLEGQKLTTWARAVYEDALTYGLTHVLVDYPVVPDAPTLNRVDEQASGLRPYFVHVPACHLFFWSSSRDNTGVRSLDEVRFRQTIEEQDGEFGLRCKEQIRRYTRTNWETWERAGDSDWRKIGEGTHSFGRVPLLTFYSSWSGFMRADPPLEDLAWLNLAHWQSMSDQRNILRVVRVAILFAKGFGDGDPSRKSGKLTIGPNMVVEAGDPTADLSYVEHSGKGIEAGAQDLKDLEERMVQLGLRPFIERTQVRTATTSMINEASAATDSSAWKMTFGQFITELYRMAGEWISESPPDSFAATLSADDFQAQRAESESRLLLDMRKAREITSRTFLSEVKRRGSISDTLDIEQEIIDLEAEAPPDPVDMFNDPNGQDPNAGNDPNAPDPNANDTNA